MTIIVERTNQPMHLGKGQKLGEFQELEDAFKQAINELGANPPEPPETIMIYEEGKPPGTVVCSETFTEFERRWSVNRQT